MKNAESALGVLCLQESRPPRLTKKNRDHKGLLTWLDDSAWGIYADGGEHIYNNTVFQLSWNPEQEVSTA